MSKTTIQFGLIGAGVAAETHARELARVEGGAVRSIYARNRAKAETFAKSYGVPLAFDDMTAFLADPELDAVIITTPNGNHRDHALAAARAGKHIVVEKPLEINAARASDIIDACHAAGVRLHVIYQRRYSEAARQALQDVNEGKLGQILLVNIVDNQFRLPGYYEKDAWRGTKDVEGGGCVITQATHLIDLAQHVAGPVTGVYAHTRTAFHQIETEDVAVAVFEFENGALGTFSTSTAAFPGLRHLLTICGTKGTIMLNGEHDQIVFRVVEGEPANTKIPEGFSFADPIDPRDYPTEGQRRQLQAIVQNLLSEDMPPPPTDRALRSVEVVDAIYTSAREGRRIVIA